MDTKSLQPGKIYLIKICAKATADEIKRGAEPVRFDEDLVQLSEKGL